MLRVIEQTPHRLVLRDQRPGAGSVAVIFLALSVSAESLLVVQGWQDFSARIRQYDGALWALAMGSFIALGIGLVLLGVMATIHFWVGTRGVFDKDSAEWTVTQVAFFRPKTRTHSLYAIRQIDIEENESVHVFGVFLVLKDSTRIPLAAYQPQDEAAMRAVVAELRRFLWP